MSLITFPFSVKYIGFFTYLTIGVTVIIDLWNLLDIKRKIPLRVFYRHFKARFIGLIVLPFAIYLFWFWVHFAVLKDSGPGNAYMSPAFQETLANNPLQKQAIQINFFDKVLIKNKATNGYLHSHLANYPLRYDDGRVSSQGQQVTATKNIDLNSEWMLVPADSSKTKEPDMKIPNRSLVRLYHVNTDSYLLTHDVAAPWYATNEEFTTVKGDDSIIRHNETLFELVFDDNVSTKRLMRKSSIFRIVHHETKVSMWTQDTKPLPDWGFGQNEVNGNKRPVDPANIWFVDDIVDVDNPERLIVPEKKPKHMPFLRKYIELQKQMFVMNNKLTGKHPYMSNPITWPLLVRGISFWTNNALKQQIYFIGNPLTWWISGMSIVIVSLLMVVEQLFRRRGVHLFDRITEKRLYSSCGFFLLAWATHYLPFYLMGRQLFLHHYLPAHICQCLLFGALTQFIFTRTFGAYSKCNRLATAGHTNGGDYKENDKHLFKISSEEAPLVQWLFTAVFTAIAIYGFWRFAPVTYGTPSLTEQQVSNLKWLSTYEMHFQKS